MGSGDDWMKAPVYCSECSGIKPYWAFLSGRKCRRERECLQAEILSLIEVSAQRAAACRQITETK
jgi:hypothetical protein